jgi:hypothetical protein
MTVCRPFICPVLEISLTAELLSDTAGIVANAKDNHATLQELSDTLCSSLFAARNEIKRCQAQCRAFSSIHARKNVIPALIEHYPRDFMFQNGDVLDPEEAYDRIIEKVGRRIKDLKLPAGNEHIVTRTFFLEFIDQIDIASDFQKRVKVSVFQQKLSAFCQMNSQSVQSLSSQKRDLLGRAATGFQWVQCRNTISYNLTMAINANNLLGAFPPTAIMMAVAMSGNVEVSSFAVFAGRYLRDPKILDVIMTPHEQELIARLNHAMDEVTRIANKVVSLA